MKQDQPTSLLLWISSFYSSRSMMNYWLLNRDSSNRRLHLYRMLAPRIETNKSVQFIDHYTLDSSKQSFFIVLFIWSDERVRVIDIVYCISYALLKMKRERNVERTLQYNHINVIMSFSSSRVRYVIKSLNDVTQSLSYSYRSSSTSR